MESILKNRIWCIPMVHFSLCQLNQKTVQQCIKRRYFAPNHARGTIRRSFESLFAYFWTTMDRRLWWGTSAPRDVPDGNLLVNCPNKSLCRRASLTTVLRKHRVLSGTIFIELGYWTGHQSSKMTTSSCNMNPPYVKRTRYANSRVKSSNMSAAMRLTCWVIMMYLAFKANFCQINVVNQHWQFGLTFFEKTQMEKLLMSWKTQCKCHLDVNMCIPGMQWSISKGPAI